MLFHKHNKTLPNLKLSINGGTIDQVTRFNSLGLHLSSQPRWHTHIEKISKNNSRVTRLIYKTEIFCLQKLFYLLQYADSSAYKLLYFVLGQRK